MKLLGLVAFAVGMTVYQAWALVILWGWFGVSLGLPALSLGAAVGVHLLYQAIRSWPHDQANRDAFSKELDERLGVVVANEILRPATALAVGWIVHRLAA